MDPKKLQEQIEQLTGLIGTFVPLVGTTFTIYNIVKAIATKTGTDLGPFSEEIAKNDQALLNLQAAISDYYNQTGAKTPPVSNPNPNVSPAG